MCSALSLFLSDWEIVDIKYRGKDPAEKTRCLITGYYMVLICVIMVVGFYE